MGVMDTTGPNREKQLQTAESGDLAREVNAQNAPPPVPTELPTEDVVESVPLQYPAPERVEEEIPDDNYAAQYDEHRQAETGEDAIARMELDISGSGGAGGGAGATASFDQTEKAGKDAIAGAKKAGFGKGGGKESMALDVMRGVGEAPSQMLGGARDAFQEMGDLGQELSGIQIPDLPDVKAPTSKTGGAIRSISQFVTGFYTGGRVLKGVKMANSVRPFVQGAIADFAAFDGHDKRLSDLLNEVPVLQDIVPDILNSDAKDSEIQGRLKNAIEGAGLGVLPGAVLKGLGKSIEYIRAGRKAKALGGADIVGETAAKLKPDFSPLGDPEGKGYFVKKTANKIEDGLEATAGTTPGEIAGATGKQPADVFINFAKIDSPEDVKAVIQKMANMGKEGIDDAKRGVRTWQMTKESAEKVDAWNTLMSRRKGAPLNAEESLATRQLWVASGEKLKEVAMLAASAPSEANLFNFRKMLATHYAIQKEVTAVRAETARALGAWKIPAGAGDLGAGLDEILQASGGPELAREMAQKIAMLSDAKMMNGLEQFVQGTAFARTRSAVAQVWINSLLSNPATHVVNTLSNFSVAAQQIYERKTAEFLSAKLGTEGGVELGEAMAMTHGMLQAFKESLQATAKNIGEMKSPKDVLESVRGVVDADVPVVGGFGAEAPRTGALSAETWNVARDTTLGKALDAVDVASTLPGRLLSRSDMFFKSMGYRMELNAQATRLATQEMRSGVISPDGFKKRVAEILENPPEDVKIDAINAATYATFQQKPAALAKKLADGWQSIPVIGRLTLPFKNTPINIATYAFERTPLAPLIKSWRADIAAGGSRADIAMARTSTGTMIMMMGIDMALSGKITGKGPEETGQRANWIKSNQPYSIKIGDTSYAYNRLDPVGFTLGMAADIAETIVNAQDDISDKDFEKVMVGAMFSITNNVMSKQYMRGMAELVEAVASSKIKGSGYMNRLVGSAFPAGGAAMARHGIPGVLEGDPYMRVADGMVQSFRRRVPGLSKDLPLYRDLWGRHVDYRSGQGWAVDMFSPVYMKRDSAEPIDKELSRLQYYPDMPKRDFEYKGVRLQLDSAQYSRYVELAGNELKSPTYMNKGAKDFLNDLVTGKAPMSAVYNIKSDGPDGYKAKMIRAIREKYQDLAKSKMIEEDAGLRVQYEERKAQQPGRLMPEFYGR